MSHGILDALCRKYSADKADDRHGYASWYEEHLPQRVGSLLELGVMDGCSLRVWRKYYPYAVIVGVDIATHAFVPGCTILHGDATDLEFVCRHLNREWGVIIDDASHLTGGQQQSFGLLWPMVVPGGSYVVEDLHTSYLPTYITSPKTTVDWLREEVDGKLGEVTFFSRTGEWDEDDSITAIVRKPS